MSIDDTIAPARSTGRAPVVLQVLPSLVSGGVEDVYVTGKRVAGISLDRRTAPQRTGSGRVEQLKAAQPER